jgi:hypothetical protein
MLRSKTLDRLHRFSLSCPRNGIGDGVKSLLEKVNEAGRRDSADEEIQSVPPA